MNEEVRKGISKYSLRRKVQKIKLTHFGHLKSMEVDITSWKLIELSVRGGKPRGRPRRR